MHGELSRWILYCRFRAGRAGRFVRATLASMSNPTLPDDLRHLNERERQALSKIAGSSYERRKDAEHQLRLMLLAQSVSRRLAREGK